MTSMKQIKQESTIIKDGRAKRVKQRWQRDALGNDPEEQETVSFKYQGHQVMFQSEKR